MDRDGEEENNGGPPKGSSADWVRRHREALVPAAHQYYDPPLVLVSGKDRVVTDADGRSYLDFYGGILTVSVGHQNPMVIAAVEEQVRLLTHTSTLYVSPPMVELAERLAKITPEPLQQTFFTTSGTEANETAIAMAQDATGESEVIALRHSYSGRSQLAMNLTGQAPWRNTSTALPVRHAHNAYCYRCPFGKTPDKCGLECAQDLDELIQTSTNGHPAAFIAEPIQGVGGFITPPPAYFQEAVGIARRYGALFISDEVQTGFGRTGRWFGIDHYGVTPDIMTFAKGLANGLPIGATVTTRAIASRYRGPTISTFGGSPIPMRAALATLDVIEGENLPNRVHDLGQELRQGLDDLGDRYSVIGDVRGLGLMLAMEFVRHDKKPAPDLARAFLGGLRERGLLVGLGGLWNNAVRIAPPMTVSREEVATALKVMREAMEDLYHAEPDLCSVPPTRILTTPGGKASA